MARSGEMFSRLPTLQLLPKPTLEPITDFHYRSASSPLLPAPLPSTTTADSAEDPHVLTGTTGHAAGSGGGGISRISAPQLNDGGRLSNLGGGSGGGGGGGSTAAATAAALSMSSLSSAAVAAMAASSPVYGCPLYKTSVRAGVLSTTGQSSNFIVHLGLCIPSHTAPDFWVMQGVAALCALDD